MIQLRKNSRFETEVHIGLLGIVFLLLALNLLSNIAIYRGRTSSRDTTQSNLSMAALAAARHVTESFPQQPDSTSLDRIRSNYHLTSLILVPSRPESNEPSKRREWFTRITRNLPPGQIPELAHQLVGSEPEKLTRGVEDEYFIVNRLPSSKNGQLLIVSMKNSTLAHLEDSSDVIIIVSIAALLIVAMAYLYLYRFIFAPFRKINRIATRAGRASSSETDVDAIVADYQRIIDELETDKNRLNRVNETITDRMRSLEQFNDYLLESIESGIVTLDMSGRVITVSARAAEMFEVEPLEYQGDSYERLFEPCRSILVDISATVNDGRPSPYREHKLRLHGDEEKVLGVTLSAVNDKANTRLGYAVLMTDHTELYKLQQELESRKRLTAMGEMAGGLAHQLRNSLGAISGYGTLVKRKLTNSGLPVKPAEDLLCETEEASELISQFLNFTKPFQLAAVESSLKRFLEDILDSCRQRSSARQIDYRLTEFDDLYISLDPLLLKQALGNILDNAAEAYGEERGVVTVEVTHDSHEVRVVVEDRGCGIEPDDLDQIFTPFFSKRASGTGLGLPLAAKFVNLHEGYINVESTPGEGTRFIITLPLSLSASPDLA